MKNKVYLFLLLCCLANFSFANTDKHLPNEANPSLTDLTETNISNIEETFTNSLSVNNSEFDCSQTNISGFKYLGKFGNSSYYCSDTDDFTYWQAKTAAESSGGFLANICSSSVNDFLKNSLLADVAWIGLNDESSEGHFRWVSGSTCGYRNWASGEPNNDHNTNQFHGADHTILSRHDGKWRDRNGSAKYEFIMEIPCDGSGGGSGGGGNTTCNPSTLASWNLDACFQGFFYNEFKANTNRPSGFSDVDASIVSNTGFHSCTNGERGEGLCTEVRNSCSFKDNSSDAFKFTVTVRPSSGRTGVLTGLEFFEDLPSNRHERATRYGVRVLKNGREVFKRTDISTSVGWSRETFDFSNDSDFEFTGQTTFSFELLGYCNSLSNKTIWEIDEIKVFGCSEIIDPCAGQGGDSDGDGVCDNQDNCRFNANADQADNDGDGIF